MKKSVRKPICASVPIKKHPLTNDEAYVLRYYCMLLLNHFMRFSLLALPMLLAQSWATSQIPSGLRFQISVNAKLIAADPLGKLYVVTPSNEVQQYAQDGSILYRYNNNTLGELTRIDATDPFQLMLYYEEYQTVVILDRTLNPLSAINLWEFGIRQPVAPAMSNDNVLWVYDHADFRLRKLDRQGNTLYDSGDLNIILDATPRPVEIVARHNLIVINDPDTGLLVFDNFGQYLQTLPLPGSSHIQLPDPDRILLYREDRWISYHIQVGKQTALDLPESVPSDAQLIAVGKYIFTLHNGLLQCWNE